MFYLNSQTFKHEGKKTTSLLRSVVQDEDILPLSYRDNDYSMIFPFFYAILWEALSVIFQTQKNTIQLFSLIKLKSKYPGILSFTHKALTCMDKHSGTLALNVKSHLHTRNQMIPISCFTHWTVRPIRTGTVILFAPHWPMVSEYKYPNRCSK